MKNINIKIKKRGGDTMKLIKSKKLLKISAVVLSMVLLCGAMSTTVSAAPAVASGVKDLTIDKILTNIINWALGLIAAVSIVFIIYAGIKWVISEGVEEKQKEARKMLTASVIGLVIALAAYAIVRVVMSNIFGISF